MEVIKNITKGIIGLLSSRKGALCLIILACITVLCYLGRIDGTSFAACCTIISSVFCFVQSKTDRDSMRFASGNSSNPIVEGIGTLINNVTGGPQNNDES